MSDKHDKAADYIRSIGTMTRADIAAYLRSQFPEPAKIEEEIPCVHTTCEYFDIEMPENCGGESGGEPALCTCVKYLKSSALITALIEKLEAGKTVEVKRMDCSNCRWTKTGFAWDCAEPTPRECKEGSRDCWQPLPSAPKEAK